MKYLKPPMLSMNFSENKEGMKKRISNILSTSRKYSGKICLGLLVFGVCVIGGLVGCSTKDVNEVDDTVRKTFTSDLESAISQAILSNNTGKYLTGETIAEGHVILDTAEEDGNAVIYALTTYGEYAFENNIFTKVSGTCVIPTIITLSKNTKNNIKKGIKKTNYLYKNNKINFNQYFSSIENYKYSYKYVDRLITRDIIKNIIG